MYVHGFLLYILEEAERLMKRSTGFQALSAFFESGCT